MTSHLKQLLKNGSSLAAFSLEEMQEELLRRTTKDNQFPLEVFHPKIKPLIVSLNKHLDIPSSFIGLALLSAYSTAIGTAYYVSPNGQKRFPLSIWGALVGLSSSGKSMVTDIILKPLMDIQSRFSASWKEKTDGLSADQREKMKLETIVYRDSHLPTLLRYVLPDNPKSVLKDSDELLEWINGMNQLSKKEGTDEQFWVSAWSGKPYSAIRSRKEMFTIERMFLNVLGGTQYSVIHRFFERDRDKTGFVYRILWVLPGVDKIAEPETSFSIPTQFTDLYTQSINRLYFDLPVHSHEQEPRICLLTPAAVKIYDDWCRLTVKSINAMTDFGERDAQGGIFGKIKEYALRFAAILHLIDNSFLDEYGNDFFTAFHQEEPITGETMLRALKLSNYFFNSAIEVYEKAQTSITAPPEVVICAALLKRGKDKPTIGEILYGERTDATRKKVERNIKLWSKQYPKVFGTKER